MKYLSIVLLFCTTLLYSQDLAYIQSLQNRDTIVIQGDTLFKQNLFSDDFTVTTEDGTFYDYNPGTYYAGDSAVVSVFDSTAIGFIKGQNFINGIFFTPLLEPIDSFQCLAPDPGWLPINLLDEQITNVKKKVRVYYILRNDIVTKRNGVDGAINYLTSLFAGKQKLFENEGIRIEIAGIKAFQKKDPFGSGTTFQILSKCKDYLKGNYPGDLAHLISQPNRHRGGIAWVDVLCAKTLGIAYSELKGDGNKVPTYSWDVSVMTHEMGHNLGSPHTHSCSWPGGPLDNCYKKEGNCNANGSAPKNGGTIMSYCHLTPHGINFSNGFGEVPGNLIRAKVNSATCLLDVDTELKPTCTDGIQNGNETGIDCGGDCGPCSEIDYCSPGNPRSNTEWIASIKIGNYTNNSGSNRYTKYPDVINVAKGIDIPIRLTPGFKSKVYKEGWSIYIDTDHNGFTESDKVYSGVSEKIINSTIKIPANAINGPTRMRVYMAWGKAAKSCQTYSYGEVEDYTVNIAKSDGCKEPTISLSVQNGKVNAKVSNDVIKVDFELSGEVLEVDSKPFQIDLDDCSKEVRARAFNGCSGKEIVINRKVTWQ